MRLFRAKWIDPHTGRDRFTRNWYVAFRDNKGVMRRIAAFQDKHASIEFGRRLERLASMRGSGQPIDGETRAWLEQLPDRTRRKLAGLANFASNTPRREPRKMKPGAVASPRMSLIDATALGASVPIETLLEEFEQDLLARGNTPAHALRAKVRASRVLVGSGTKTYGTIRADAVEHFLRREREKAVKPLGARTSNYLLQATRQFCRWFIRTGRANEDPLRVIRPLNPALDERRERRALTAEEMRKIIEEAEKGPTLFGLTGADRAMLYRLAVETGLRANELRTLRISNLELESDTPSVTVLAANSKRRREDKLPLKLSTARALADHLRGRGPFEPVFTIARCWRSAEMFAADREAAKVAKEDAFGRVSDFHGLRHTFVTNLVRGGVSPKVAQELARHSTITLTMDRYAHVRVEDTRDALRALPDLDAPVAADRRAKA